MSFVAEINNYFSSHVSDLNRTKLYQEQKKREKARIRFASLEEYNDSLNTEVICAIARQEHAERIAELSQRTNQFNLSDRRYTADEINNHIVMYLSASDKYGDMGIVGAAVVNDSIIESFYISCRVFGRGFEHVLLDAIKNLRAGKPMYGVYNSTDKNYRYANFYLDNGVNIYA